MHSPLALKTGTRGRLKNFRLVEKKEKKHSGAFTMYRIWCQGLGIHNYKICEGKVVIPGLGETILKSTIYIGIQTRSD
jgi:hypothetical protein